MSAFRHMVPRNVHPQALAWKQLGKWSQATMVSCHKGLRFEATCTDSMRSHAVAQPGLHMLISQHLICA